MIWQGHKVAMARRVQEQRALVVSLYSEMKYTVKYESLADPTGLCTCIGIQEQPKERNLQVNYLPSYTSPYVCMKVHGGGVPCGQKTEGRLYFDSRQWLRTQNAAQSCIPS